MRIAFVVERPTQFEAPFFRVAAADPEHSLRVLFTRPEPAGEAFDPELGRAVSWGIDLLGGYDWSTAPARGMTRWLTAELRPERCDLAVVNGYTQRPYILASLLARRAGVPVALRLDSVRSGEAPTARERARRLLLAGLLGGIYDLFLGVGTLTLEYLAWCGVPEERRGLLPYPLDAERFGAGALLRDAEREALRVRLGIPEGARAVLCVSKLHPRESPWDLLRAIARLSGSRREYPLRPGQIPPGRPPHPDLFLLLAGDGPERPALERFASEHLPGRTRFLGYVPYPELPSLYGAADLFVHPAREERWGVSVAEALAAGIPVIASSRVGAARDLLVPGANGFTYEAGGEADLALRIAAALALDRQAVRTASSAILPRWDCAAAWASLLAAAGRSVQRRQARHARQVRPRRAGGLP